MNRFEAFKDMQDKWRWRLIGTAGRVLVSSNDSFGSQIDALRAAELIKLEGSDASISEATGVGPKEVIARLIQSEEARRLKAGIDDRGTADRRRTPRRSRGMRRTRFGGARPQLRVVGARRPA